MSAPTETSGGELMAGRFTTEIIQTPLPAVVARGFFITADKLDQMEEPMQRAISIIQNEIAANFEMEGRPNRWKDLEDSTQQKKALAGLDPRILRALGQLYQEATSSESWRVQRQGSDWIAQQFDITDHGSFHITGFVNRGGGFVEARDWSFVSDDALQDIEDEFYEWLDEVMDQAGVGV
jgi:hypothetical protein